MKWSWRVCAVTDLDAVSHVDLAQFAVRGAQVDVEHLNAPQRRKADSAVGCSRHPRRATAGRRVGGGSGGDGGDEEHERPEDGHHSTERNFTEGNDDDGRIGLWRSCHAVSATPPRDPTGKASLLCSEERSSESIRQSISGTQTSADNTQWSYNRAPVRNLFPLSLQIGFIYKDRRPQAHQVRYIADTALRSSTTVEDYLGIVLYMSARTPFPKWPTLLWKGRERWKRTHNQINYEYKAAIELNK